MKRKTTVYFHKVLQKYTDGYEEFTSEGDSYIDIVINCIRMFPNLEKVFKIIATRNINEELVLIENREIVPFENYILPPKKDCKLILCPVIGGGGGNTNIILIIALVVIVVLLWWNPGSWAFASSSIAAGGAGATGASVGAVAASATVTTLGSIAIGLAINIAITLLTPTAKSQVSSGGRPTRNNDAYEGLVNTSSTSTPVTLNYGNIRVAGQLVSGYTKTIDHGESDIIEVKDYL